MNNTPTATARITDYLVTNGFEHDPTTHTTRWIKDNVRIYVTNYSGHLLVYAYADVPHGGGGCDTKFLRDFHIVTYADALEALVYLRQFVLRHHTEEV